MEPQQNIKQMGGTALVEGVRSFIGRVSSASPSSPHT